MSVGKWSIIAYLNPIERLGKEKYSFLFPLLSNIFLCVGSEIFVYHVAHNPLAVGSYIIFLNAGFIIYFAFRDGLLGGFISTFFAISYYFYIVYTRHYQGQQYKSGVETITELSAIYVILAFTIGWLKQTIDKLIEREAQGRQRLETIIQQLPVGIIVVDREGKVIHENKQVEKIFGMKLPPNYTVGKDSILTGTHRGKPNKVSDSPLYQAITLGKSATEKEYDLIRADGKKVTIRVNVAPVWNKNAIIAAAQIFSDITEQKELDRQKDDFVSMASHELKTPLTSQKAYLEILKRLVSRKQYDQIGKYIERVEAQGRTLIELVAELLDMSRVRTGKMHYTEELFRLDSLLEETVETMQKLTKAHVIKLKNTAHVTILADKYRITQVLGNLLTNAIKYSPEGKEILVALKKEGNNALIQVQDFGIGIAKGEHQKIFDRLYQVTDPHEKTFPGLGMGLYISREIIKHHKGRIWVESEKGKGSTFLLTIPLSARRTQSP